MIQFHTLFSIKYTIIHTKVFMVILMIVHVIRDYGELLACDTLHFIPLVMMKLNQKHNLLPY